MKTLRFTKNPAAATAEVEAMGGRVLHQFGSEALVAELPDQADPTQMKASTAQPAATLAPGTELAVEAWRANEAEGARAPSPQEGLAWDAAGYESPKEPEVEGGPQLLSPANVQPSSGTPTSLYLVGSVAVGVVMVSRNTGPERMTAAEQQKVVQEVQRGLDWLASAEPRARVSFVYDLRPITVTTPPGPYLGQPDAYERMEAGWRDAALTGMGYPGGRAGYQAYAQALRAGFGTNWSYVAFFTRYPLNHFAYAIWEKVVMHYENDGWGPENLHRVFAHETCHIFGAADEYGGCSCGGAHGHLRVPNNNCVNCPGTQKPCLMNANTLEMCDFSRRQIGWDKSLYPTRPAREG